MATQGHEGVAPAGDPAALDDTGALIHALFDAAPLEMGVIEIDEQGELFFVVVNAAHARFLGVESPSMLRGTTLAQTANQETQDIWRARCEEARASGQQVRFERNRWSSRPGVSLATLSYLGCSATGRPRFAFTMTDVTAHRNAEERLRSILESSPGLIMTLDRDFNIVTMNGPLPGIEKLVGTNALRRLLPEHAHIAQAAYEAALMTGEIRCYELPVMRPDGSLLAWYASAVGPLRQGGEIVGMTIISNEITARVKLADQAREATARAEADAAELARKNEELEREIGERRRAEELLLRKQEEIRALSTPIIEVGEGVLAAPIIGVLDEARAGDLMERLLRAITASRIRVSIIDLTGVAMVDASAATHLLQIVRAAGLVGSRCVLSGISPSIAQTMVSLGVGLESLTTFRTLKDALREVLARA